MTNYYFINFFVFVINYLIFDYLLIFLEKFEIKDKEGINFENQVIY